MPDVRRARLTNSKAAGGYDGFALRTTDIGGH